MKTSLLLMAMFLSIQVWAQDDFDSEKIKGVVKELDLAHARAIFEGDALALDSLMSDNVVVNHPTNRIVNEKKELLRLIKEGTIRYTAFERTPEKFLCDENMVIVMGREVVVPAAGAPNEGKELQRRYTNVWMKNDAGKWQLTVRHAHNICP